MPDRTFRFPDGSAPWSFRASLIRVIDADTVDFLVDPGFHLRAHVRVRLFGVDCPERNTTDGRFATAFTTTWLAQKTVILPRVQWPFTLTTAKDDAFGRWLAIVEARDGTDLSSALFAAGHAKPWARSRRKSTDA